MRGGADLLKSKFVAHTQNRPMRMHKAIELNREGSPYSAATFAIGLFGCCVQLA